MTEGYLVSRNALLAVSTYVDAYFIYVYDERYSNIDKRDYVLVSEKTYKLIKGE